MYLFAFNLEKFTPDRIFSRDKYEVWEIQEIVKPKPKLKAKIHLGMDVAPVVL